MEVHKEFKCQICGKLFYPRLVRKSYKPKFCGYKCYGIYRKKLPISDKTRKKLKEQSILNWRNPQIREKRINGLKIPCSGIKKAKISKANKVVYSNPIKRKEIAERNKGEKSHFWKGGISSKNQLLRKSRKFANWREKVFKRDNFTCQKCGKNNQNGNRTILHPHHLKELSKYPKLVYRVKNGITLCLDCHQKLHKNIKFIKQNYE